MNKSYKSVWNESTGTWVAVSENATGRSKSKRAKTAISKAILTQIAVGGMSVAGMSAAMAGDAVKFGTGSSVSVADGIAIGTNAGADVDTDPSNVDKTGGVAIGMDSYVVGSGVAIGNSAQAGSESLAFGAGAIATNNSTAVGNNAVAINKHAVALGEGASAGGQGSLALGAGASVGTTSSVALGEDSVTDRDNSVSVGSDTIKRQITNVAAATQDNDAVTLKQLKDAGITTNTTGGVTNSFVAYDDSSKKAVTLNNGGDAVNVKNVAAGVDATDAINKGQLDAVSSQISTTTTALKYLRFGTSNAQAANATGTDSLAIGGNAFASQTGSLAFGRDSVSAGNQVSAKGANSVVLGSGSDGSQDNVVSVGGTGAGAQRKIVNVAAGTTTTDAVNYGQLTTAIASVTTGGTGGTSYVSQDSTSKDLLVGSAVDGTHVNFANSTGTARELINVAAGTKATSAVNLSQLSPVVAALGGGAAVNPTTGAVTGPTYVIGGKTANNAGDAFKNVDDSLNTLNSTVAAISDDLGGAGLVAQDAATGNITVGKLVGGTVVDMTNSSGAQRTITGVAAGNVSSSSFDAINGSQLFSASRDLATAIGGGAMVSTDGKGTITLPSFSVGKDTYNNVGDAITGLDTRIDGIVSSGGVATPNAVAYDSDAHDKLTVGKDGATALVTGLTDGALSATSTDAVTGKQLFETKTTLQDNIDALQASVTNIASTGSTSIGINGTNGTNGANGVDGAPAAASASGNDAIAMGDNASASGDHAVVIGGGASGTADGVIAIGGNSNASGKDSIAIGNGATAPATNAVALGAGSVADRDNTVSMGSEGKERQITNVAAGTKGTDAVNLNQMNSAVGGVARKAYSGIAAATALTMIPDVDANKTLSIGIGGGTFQGYAATAIGGTARITQNIKVRVGAGWSAAGTTVGAGASYQW